MSDTNVAATMDETNTRSVSCWLQNEAPSSSQNSTPLIGAPNAAATPCTRNRTFLTKYKAQVQKKTVGVYRCGSTRDEISLGNIVSKS